MEHYLIWFYSICSVVEFLLKGKKCLLKGTLCLGIADNPASQALGRYKMLASGLCKCRHCLAVNSEIQTKVFYAHQVL